MTTKKPKLGRPPIKATPLPPSLKPGRLRTFQGRKVPIGAEPDLHEQVEWARSQIARVAAGEFSHRRAPTILKAASSLLDEAIGKLEERSRVALGVFDLAAAVRRATELNTAKRAALPSEPDLSGSPASLPAASALVEITPAVVSVSEPAPVGELRPSDVDPWDVPGAMTQRRPDGCVCDLSNGQGHHLSCPVTIREAQDRARRTYRCQS